MASAGEVDVKLTITPNTKGATKVEQGLERVQKAAKKTANDTKSSFDSLGQKVEKVSSVVGKFNAVLTGFGLAGIIMNVVNAFKALHEWINKDTKAAQDLYKELQEKSAAEQIERVADAYKKVSDAIKETSELRQIDNELQSDELRITRDTQDAQIDLAEQKELAAVDESSETAAEEKAQISAKYAALRGQKTTERYKEDILLARQRHQENAESATAAADAIEATFENDEKAIAAKRLEARTQKALSRERNEKDGTWYSPGKKTEEGDELRAQQKSQAEKAEKEADALQKELDRKRKEVETLRRNAATSLAKRDLLWESLGAADTRQEASALQGNIGVRQANQSMAKKEAEIRKREAQAEKDSAFIASATSRRATIQGKIDDAKQTLAGAENTLALENRDVWQAQQNLELFNMQNAGRHGGAITRQRAALAETIQEEQRQAEAAGTEFQKVRSSVAKILVELKREMAQFEAELKNAQSREKARAEQTGAAE